MAAAPEGAAQKAARGGYSIASFDECCSVRDKATGRKWIEYGRKAAQLYMGSHKRIALFGYEDCTRRFQEYAFANSYAMIYPFRYIAVEYGRVAIIVDRMPAHCSKALKRFLRSYRYGNSRRTCVDLPAAQLAVPERRREVVAHAQEGGGTVQYYPRLDGFCWAASEYLRPPTSL